MTLVAILVAGGLALLGIVAVFSGLTGMVEEFAHMVGDAIARRDRTDAQRPVG